MGNDGQLIALVTAGGTREPIDDVRKVTNISSGRFGIRIAKALAAAGVHVKLLLGHTAQLHARDLNDHNIQCFGFDSFADLQRMIAHFAEGRERPDIVFMAAAVSDYTPIAAEGKISSNQDELVVRMKRNPKLLGAMRKQFGIETFIVGFKLLSGVTQDELVSVAHNQVRKCRINLCLANDLANLRDGYHPALMVTPEGGAIPLGGSKEDVARDLVDFVLKRQNVRWFRSVHMDDRSMTEDPRVTSLLKFAQETALLRDSNGNVSVRDGKHIRITPRQIDKSEIGPESVIPIFIDTAGRRNIYYGPTEPKPSIDSGVHQLLYERLPDIDCILHFHNGGIVIPTATTSFPHACGTVEEANEMCRTLSHTAARGEYHGRPFALKLVHHGYVLGMDEESMYRMFDDWGIAVDEYVEHLLDIDEDQLAKAVLDNDPDVRLSPIFMETDVIGVFAERLSHGYASCYLTKQSRNNGWGYQVMDELIAHGVTIGAHNNCAVASWYQRHGWAEIRREDVDGNVTETGRMSILIPPTQRDDLIYAATACIINPIEQTVLLGKRLTSNWHGCYAFPGGKIEDGETPEQAVRRELGKEAHIQLYDDQPVAVRRFYTGTKNGTLAFAVDCHVFLTVHSPTPQKSAELDAKWVPLAPAWRKAPMGQATRRMLLDMAARYCPNR